MFRLVLLTAVKSCFASPLAYDTVFPRKELETVRRYPLLWKLITVYATALYYDSKDPKSRVLLEKPNGSQLVKKFLAFYGTRRFISTFKSARHLSLSWASTIQSIHPHPTSSRCILILSSHLLLRLPCGIFPSGFPTKTQYTPLLSPNRATCHAHLILGLITRKIMDEKYLSLSIIMYLSTIWKN
jgi:hypothetical protein